MLSNKKLLFGALCSLFLLWYILGENGSLLTEFAHAQGVAAGSGDLDLTQFLKKAAIFFDFSMFLIFALINICSALLDPEFIFAINGLQAAGGGANEPGMLLSIWQLSRNLTNVIFAFMLVFVALYAVIIPTQGGEFMKAHVAKFILAIILVNFSWFFPRVILDTANVLAATIFSLPASIGTECKTQNPDGTQTDCKFIAETWLFPMAVRSNAEDNTRRKDCVSKAEAKNADYVKISNLVCVKLAPYDKKFNTGLAVLHGLYVNHMRIIQTGKVVQEPGPADGEWANLEELGRFIVQFMFILFYTIASLFPLLAMMVVLLIRIPIIWLTVAFMPFMFVGFVMGDKMGEANTIGIFKHFVKAAFLPAIMAIPLTVGFIMLNAAIGSECPGDGPYHYLCEDQGMLISSVKNLWTLLWSFVAIIVMWVGVFTAVQKIGGLYARAAGAVQNVGQNWARFALKVPLALPVIPTEGGRKSLMNLVPPELIRNPNLMIKGGELGKRDIRENFRDGGGLEANRIASEQKAILERIAKGMKDGNQAEISAALQQLSVKMGNSAERMRSVLTAEESTLRREMDPNRNIGQTNIDVVLREADAIDAQRTGGGAGARN